MNSGFPSLSGGHDDMEEGFWSSFSNVMMVILKIFLLVIVVMALNNRNLLDDLKHSVRAKEVALEEAQKAAVEAQKSAQKAEFQIKENATLEDQLEYLQQRSSSLEMELLRSRAETEEAHTASSNQNAELTRLQALSGEQASAIASRDKTLNDLQSQFAGVMAERERSQSELTAARDSATSKETELTSLRSKVDESEKKLLSLQGDYTSLDQKYQKLLKPARSAKGKQVVEVVYSKSGYSIRKPGEGAARSVGRDALESELGGLKTQYGTDLYVKVIIPDNSGLSYNDAWRFTNDILSKYDYYHQPDSSTPAE
jgi:myosin heavy subunit